MVYSVPTGQVVPTSGQVVDSTCECSGVSTTDFYQLTGSVQLKLLNDSCSTNLPLPRNPPNVMCIFVCYKTTHGAAKRPRVGYTCYDGR